MSDEKMPADAGQTASTQADADTTAAMPATTDADDTRAAAPVAVIPAKGATEVIRCASERKRAAFVALLDDATFEKVLVFTRSKRSVDRIAGFLSGIGINAHGVHANTSDESRDLALAAMREGKARVLVVTDVSAAGLDAGPVSHVVHFEQPNTIDEYEGRLTIVRTMEPPVGLVVFAAIEEKESVAAIEARLGTTLTVRPLPQGTERVMKMLEGKTARTKPTTSADDTPKFERGARSIDKGRRNDRPVGNRPGAWRAPREGDPERRPEGAGDTSDAPRPRSFEDRPRGDRGGYRSDRGGDRGGYRGRRDGGFGGDRGGERPRWRDDRGPPRDAAPSGDAPDATPGAAEVTTDRAPAARPEPRWERRDDRGPPRDRDDRGPPRSGFGRGGDRGGFGRGREQRGGFGRGDRGGDRGGFGRGREDRGGGRDGGERSSWKPREDGGDRGGDRGNREGGGGGYRGSREGGGGGYRGSREGGGGGYRGSREGGGGGYRGSREGGGGSGYRGSREGGGGGYRGSREGGGGGYRGSREGGGGYRGSREGGGGGYRGSREGGGGGYRGCREGGGGGYRGSREGGGGGYRGSREGGGGGYRGSREGGGDRGPRPERRNDGPRGGGNDGSGDE